MMPTTTHPKHAKCLLIPTPNLIGHSDGAANPEILTRGSDSGIQIPGAV